MLQGILQNEHSRVQKWNDAKEKNIPTIFSNSSDIVFSNASIFNPVLPVIT